MNDETVNTREAFSKIAANYDSQDNSNPILIWMREIVHRLCLKYLPAGSKILELNAGTGVDARFLAANGMKIFATDISEEMIRILEKNSYHEIEKGLIKAEVKSFDEISSLPEKDFDAVVSNFGGLNCINDFRELGKSLFQKLIPGGLFIAVVMNRCCPWEIFFYCLKMNFREAFRRFNRKGIYARVGGLKVKTYYYGPHRFASFFRNYFYVEKIYSLALFTPPPYLSKLFENFPKLSSFLMKTDEHVMAGFPFRLVGDHFVIVMKKRGLRELY